MIEIKSYTKKELRSFYGVSKKTFHKWLEVANIIPKIEHYYTKRLFTPKDVQLIFDKIGNPNE